MYSDFAEKRIDNFKKLPEKIEEKTADNYSLFHKKTSKSLFEKQAED